MTGERVNIMSFGTRHVVNSGTVTAVTRYQARIGGTWYALARVELCGIAIAQRLSRTAVRAEEEQEQKVNIVIT